MLRSHQRWILVNRKRGIPDADSEQLCEWGSKHMGNDVEFNCEE